jgi:hypothetical protein
MALRFFNDDLVFSFTMNVLFRFSFSSQQIVFSNFPFPISRCARDHTRKYRAAQSLFATVPSSLHQETGEQDHRTTGKRQPERVGAYYYESGSRGLDM